MQLYSGRGVSEERIKYKKGYAKIKTQHDCLSNDKSKLEEEKVQLQNKLEE